MSDDNYPFNREHWLIAVDLPVSLLAEEDKLLGEVEKLAESRGGRPAGRSKPSSEFVGRPGYTTFGASIAFEAGDVNAEGFIRLVEKHLGKKGVTVTHDPEEVYSPEDPEESVGFRR